MKMKALNRLVALLSALVIVGSPWGADHRRATGENATSQPAGGVASRAPDLIVILEDDARLVPIVAPVVGRLSGTEHPPILLVAPSPPGPQVELFLRQLSPNRRVVVGTANVWARLAEAGDIRASVVEVPESLTQAGFEIAKRFWRTCDKVVLVLGDDPTTVILGSVLAGHLRVPLIPVDRATGAEAVKALLNELKVKHVIVAGGRLTATPAWLKLLPQQTEILDLKRLERRIVRAIGPQQVRNIIVARAPNARQRWPGSAMLASYLSVARKAPVVLSRWDDGRKVESDVLGFIRAHGVKPQTVTILADYQAIGVISLDDREALGEYTVEIEPCSGPMAGGAAAFGVGRIPQASLSDASLLIARSLARERIIARRRPRVLMIANPSTEFGPLPFAETVSRVTAQEFKNFRLGIDEFYGKPANHPDALKASANAHLIIFEGHVTDQLLFEDPTPVLPEDEEIPVIEEIPIMADEDTTVGIPAQERLLRMLIIASSTEAAGNSGIVQTAPSGEAPMEPAGQLDLPPDPWQEQPAGEPVSPPAPRKPPSELNGLPLVILQSCHSLDGIVAEQVFSRGGVGLLGSVTNVHSASGSSFAKAYCDAILYRGASVGEALRDARNYFLCLARLKAHRGHKEQAKVYRVALSFRLWGDPEMRVLPPRADRPVRRPVRARFAKGPAISIATPQRRLPEARTAKYTARIYPASHVAGIVKRVKNKPQRRLMPMYFFRLTRPEWFDAHRCKILRRTGDTDARAAFLTDSLGQYVYVLYFPAKENTHEEAVLRFGR